MFYKGLEIVKNLSYKGGMFFNICFLNPYAMLSWPTTVIPIYEHKVPNLFIIKDRRSFAR